MGRVVKIFLYPDVLKNDEIERRAAMDIFKLNISLDLELLRSQLKCNTNSSLRNSMLMMVSFDNNEHIDIIDILK